MTFWLYVAVPWVLIGIAIGIVMGRRGHYLPAWLALGIAWGPFTIPIAWSAVRREPTGARHVVRPGALHGGDVDLLAAVDGSPESVSAAVRAVRLLGPRLGRLRLLRVVDFDTGGAGLREELEAIEQEHQQLAARYLPDHTPELVVTTGIPSEVIARMAQEESFALVAIGARGRGLSKAIVGSTASALTKHSPVPLLVVRNGDPRIAAPRPGRSTTAV